MRFLITLLLMAGCAFAADDVQVVQIPVSNISTSSTPSETSSTNSSGSLKRFTGYIAAIHINFASNSVSADIDVKAENGRLWADQTLFSINTISNDLTYFPRVAGQSSAGVANTNTYEFPLIIDQAINVEALNASATNQSVTVSVSIIKASHVDTD